MFSRCPQEVLATPYLTLTRGASKSNPPERGRWVPPPAQDRDATVPARCPSSGPPGSPAGKRSDRTTQTTKAEQLKQDRKLHSPSGISPRSRDSRSAPEVLPLWRRTGATGERGRAGPWVAEETARASRFRPIELCLLLLLSYWM